MKKILRFPRRKIEYYLLLGFLSLAVVTLKLELDYLFFWLGLLLLLITPVIFNLILPLRAKIVKFKKIKKQDRSKNIPLVCRQCRYYYGKVDSRYLYLCLKYSDLQKNCLDFQQ
ncbi:MAG: hypothetical protein ACFBSE_22515 [Prochloraceae cyanobacterium]